MKLLLLLFLSLRVPASEIAKPRVIYGSDGRHDAQNISDPRMQQIARRGVALMDAKDLVLRDGDTYWLKGESFGKAMNLCAGERFFDQPSVSWCSGLLIGPDLVLTAGHCLHTPSGCGETAVVFDYRTQIIPRSSAYFCKEILYEVDKKDLDFAVIRLDREVRDRSPYQVTDFVVPARGDSLVMVGHPSGLPQKITTGGQVRKIDNFHLRASLDAFEFNSGSPVFERRSMKFVGLLIAGEDDFEKRPGGKCQVAKVCAESGCRGEDVMRAEPIVEILRTLAR